MKKQKGFSLVELLVVLAIVGLLATLAVISLSGVRERARDTKRINIADSVMKAMDIVWQEKGDFDDVGCVSGPIYSCTGGDLETYIPTVVNLKDPLAPTANCHSSCNEVCEISFDVVDEDGYEFYIYLESGVANTVYEYSGCYLIEMYDGAREITKVIE